jgi:CBS domain-containing membrane protein
MSTEPDAVQFGQPLDEAWALIVKPEVVGQIMTRKVQVASAQRHVIELVPLFSNGGHHHIPIIDAENRLVAITAQTDLLRASYSAATPQGTHFKA